LSALAEATTRVESVHVNSATAGWAIDRSAIVRATNGGVARQDITPRGISLAKITVTATYFPSAQTPRWTTCCR
jgi:DNA-binding transcriptional regulator YdaS (Cro superfamily)